MLFYAIRGAITVDKDTPQEILDRTKDLLKKMFRDNEIHTEQIVSIIFTATKDLNSQYPALAARQLGMVDVPLFCCQEMYVKDSLERCIRILIHIQSSNSKVIEHIYMEKAIFLRPDLILKDLMKDEIITIAIDGPAGAGKSTISKVLAGKLNMVYLDTGAMYRAIAYKMLQQKIDLKDIPKIINSLKSTDIQIKYDGVDQRVILDGEDITTLIRTDDISKSASHVAMIPEVRIKLVEIQRHIAQSTSLVMDGRDIGSYVLPKASLKFYVTASLDERTGRRWKEYNEKGVCKSKEFIKQAIKDRDAQDEGRDFAPLKQSDDAILIDTTGKSINQVSNEILEYVMEYKQALEEGN